MIGRRQVVAAWLTVAAIPTLLKLTPRQWGFQGSADGRRWAFMRAEGWRQFPAAEDRFCRFVNEDGTVGTLFGILYRDEAGRWHRPSGELA